MNKQETREEKIARWSIPPLEEIKKNETREEKIARWSKPPSEEKEQENDESFLSDIKDYGKTILKGTAEGLGRLGQMMSGHVKRPEISDEGKIILPESKEQEKERQTKALDKLLPTDEGFVQKSIRRGLREAPSMAAFPGGNAGTLARTGIAGFAGQTAEELGLPEWAQEAAELTSFIGPDLTKKILSKGKNKELIEFAKKMGMTDSEIAPLLNSEFKQKWLSGIASKSQSGQKALSKTKKALDSTYGFIQKSDQAAKEISEKANGSLINGIYEKLNDMPRNIRSVIEKDLQDLLENKITGNSLINFWKDINSAGGPNKKQISLLKQPVKEALQSVSPELAEGFEMVNKLHSKYHQIASKLKPGKMDSIMKMGEYALGMNALSGLFMGDFSKLALFAGEKGARKLSQEMLTNPRFQQLSSKMVEAINNNKFGAAKKLSESFASLVKDEYPELSKELKNLTIEDFKNSFNP